MGENTASERLPTSRRSSDETTWVPRELRRPFEDPLLSFALATARMWNVADSGFLFLAQLQGGEAGVGPQAVLVGEVVDAAELLEDG